MHERFIKKAISLAKRARGKTSPNPLVGAVIVKGSTVIATGYHKKAGQPHAEINAINNANLYNANIHNAKMPLKGAALYVNLEPCSHFGKTPPCVDAIIKSGIKEVYIGMYDPNPLVAKSGVKKLRAHGIKVTTGILKDECERLNESFVKFITQKMPFVILKSAATIDGKTATASGDSKWITNEKSRKFVHRLRSEVDAVLIGSGTLIRDDPKLTVRTGKKGMKNPRRVILDTTLKISENANVLKGLATAQTIIFYSKKLSRENKAAALTKKGAKLIAVTEKGGRLNLKSVLKRLAKDNITSLLIEGGAAVNASFVKARLADKMYLFIAPKLILDDGAKPVFFNNSFNDSKGLIKDAINVNLYKVRRFGDDVMIEFYFGRECLQV